MKYIPEIIPKLWFVLSQSWILRFCSYDRTLSDLSYIHLVVVTLPITSNQSQNTGIAQHRDFELCFQDSAIPTASPHFEFPDRGPAQNGFCHQIPGAQRGLASPTAPLKAEALPELVTRFPPQQSSGQAAESRARAPGGRWGTEAEFPRRKAFSSGRWIQLRARSSAAPANTTSRAARVTEPAPEGNRGCLGHSWTFRDMGALRADTCKIHTRGHSAQVSWSAALPRKGLTQRTL